MGWLNDRMIQYIYTNGIEDVIIEANVNDERPPAPKGYTYKGFVPEKVNLMTKVQFEQNGRIGYKIGLGDGKSVYRSATRERYEHMIGNTGGDRQKAGKRLGIDGEAANSSVYTKAYGKKVKEAEKKKMDMHNRNLKKILKGGK